MDLFPDATAEDLVRCDNICIICREEMGTATVNKKLPCSHVFHVHCLRWGHWLLRECAQQVDSAKLVEWDSRSFKGALSLCEKRAVTSWVQWSSCPLPPQPMVAACRVCRDLTAFVGVWTYCRSWLERQQSCPICRSPVFPPSSPADAGQLPQPDGRAENGAQDPQLQQEVMGKLSHWKMFDICFTKPWGACRGCEISVLS